MLTNEEYYLAQKLARAALDTGNIDNVAGPWQQAAYQGIKTSLGSAPAANTLDAIAGAKSILAFGSNILERQAIAAIRARKAAREGATLIVAHPDDVRLKKTANLRLKVLEGYEEALVAGLIKAVVKENLGSDAELSKEAKKAVKAAKSASWQEIAEKTGLSEDRDRRGGPHVRRQISLPFCIYGVEAKSLRRAGFLRRLRPSRGS